MDVIMKYSINWLLAIILGSYGFCIAIPSLYGRVEDYSIVNAIKQKSNLTQDEVDKFKLVALGRFQEPAAALAGTYAVYKTSSKAYDLGRKTEGIPKGIFLELYFGGGILGLLSDKRFWAIAGAAGIGYGAYKVLYPRMEKGILDQVKMFIDICENLDIYNYDYSGQNYIYLSQIGTIGRKPNYGLAYNSVGLQVNAAWTNASNIARQKGIDNLLFQAGIANQLLSQIENTPDVQELRNQINVIIKHLNNNKPTIDYFAQQEMQERMRSHTIQIQGAQQTAQLDLTRQQSSALWYGKISLAVTTLSNFWDKSLKTLVYINDNKTQIAGGMATALILPIMAFKALQTWYYSQ